MLWTPALAGVLVALGATSVRAADPAAPPATVRVQFQAFGPSQVDVLPGESVTWENVSERTHTVTADDGSFGTDELLAGMSFAHRFDAPGEARYHCAIHPGMTGEVDVRAVILDPLPVSAVPAGSAVEFSGRTADPAQPVRVQRVTAAGPVTVATAKPSPDGRWTTTTAVTVAGDYLAAGPGGVSQRRLLAVTTRRVELRATRRGVVVTVVPALPYGRVTLQVDSRQHFGWWPTRTKRLDYVSEAVFATPRRARVRAVLVGPDGWTPLATSRVLTLGGARATGTPKAPGRPAAPAGPAAMPGHTMPH
jgi:plastocyanin